MHNKVGRFAYVSDTSLRDGLFHEYKKFGKVMSVSIKGEKEERFAIVTFKKYEYYNTVY